MFYYVMRAIFLTGCLLGALAGTAAAQSAQQARIDAARKAAEAAKQPTAQPAQGLSLPNQDQAKRDAEIVYNTWRVSMMRSNIQAWKNVTAASRQMKIRNMIVSRKGEFPRDFFANLQPAPKLEDFRYVGSLLGCGGRTMASTYIGMMQLGEKAQSKVNAYVLLLVQENGRWKLDQTRFFDLSRLPEVRKRLEARDLKVLQEQDGFHPYASVPAPPRACPPPELIGQVFVDCPGRTVDITINGLSPHDFSDERRADFISGGLKRGANTISYTIRDNAGQSRPSMAIGLFVMPETKGNKPVCVFDHILDATDNAQGGSFTFSISNEQIASMNPKFSGTAPQPFHAVPLKPKPKGK